MALVSFLDKSDRDGKLMLSYAQGDADAFDKLYETYRQPMFRFFLRQCNNQAVAEELYQELWMRVIRARNSYEHKAKFSTWLYRIAHHLLIDHFRSSGRESSNEDEEEIEHVPGSASLEPESLITSEETVARFLTMLEQLPQEQREVFLLKEEAGLSLDEIAQATNSSFETVKSRLRYAIKKLRLSLEENAA
jgi:RNA polymerase sigma-70 factor (ECF subfamily)